MMMEVPIIFGRTGITNVMSTHKLSIIRYEKCLNSVSPISGDCLWQSIFESHWSKFVCVAMFNGEFLGITVQKGNKKHLPYF